MKEQTDPIRENIHNAIEHSGKSRLQIAKLAKISYPHLTNYLNNKAGELGIGVLKQLAIALNLPLSYFFGDTDAAGQQILSSSGVPLPEKWDGLYKEILTLPEDKQAKLHDLIAAAMRAIR
jgi:transcriptional regulator with XRE-family HTH domain